MNHQKIRRGVGTTPDSSEPGNIRKVNKGPLAPIILRPVSDTTRKEIAARNPSFLKRCTLAQRTQSQSFTLKLPPKSSTTSPSTSTSKSSSQSGHIHIHVHTPQSQDQQGVTLTSTFQQARTLTFSPQSMPTIPHKSPPAITASQQNSEKSTPKPQRLQKRPREVQPSTPPPHKKCLDQTQDSPSSVQHGSRGISDENTFQKFMENTME